MFISIQCQYNTIWSFEAPTNYKIFSATNCSTEIVIKSFLFIELLIHKMMIQDITIMEMDKTTHVYYDDENSSNN